MAWHVWTDRLEKPEQIWFICENNARIWRVCFWAKNTKSWIYGKCCKVHWKPILNWACDQQNIYNNQNKRKHSFDILAKHDQKAISEKKTLIACSFTNSHPSVVHSLIVCIKNKKKKSVILEESESVHDHDDKYEANQIPESHERKMRFNWSFLFFVFHTRWD